MEKGSTPSGLSVILDPKMTELNHMHLRGQSAVVRDQIQEIGSGSAAKVCTVVVVTTLLVVVLADQPVVRLVAGLCGFGAFVWQSTSTRLSALRVERDLVRLANLSSTSDDLSAVAHGLLRGGRND